MAGPQLLEAHEQLAKPIQPGVRALHDPAASPAPGMPLPTQGFPPLRHMGNVAPLDHRRPGGRAGVALIRAEVVRGGGARPRPGHDHPRQGGDQQAHVVAVRPADDYRQRDSTGVHEETALGALFFPGPSGWTRRPLGRGALSRGPRPRSARPRRCPPARHIPPGLSARAGRRPPAVSSRGSTCGWNSGSRSALWAGPSTGTLSAGRTRCPRRPGGDPAVSAPHRGAVCTGGLSGDSAGGSEALPSPTMRPRQSMIGVRSYLLFTTCGGKRANTIYG